MSFAKALPFTIEDLEGGYRLTDDPTDLGGATYAGITKAQWEAAGCVWTLPLDPEEIAEFYRIRFWDVCKCSQLPEPVDSVLFQAAVNIGPKQAIQCLQNALGTIPDGDFGPVTLAAAQGAQGLSLAQGILIALRQHYLDRSNGRFLDGLLNRTLKVAAAIKDGRLGAPELA